MNHEVWQLIIEFGVILMSPIIHHYYLWRYKKAKKSVIFQNIKIYACLYALIGIAGIILAFK